MSRYFAELNPDNVVSRVIVCDDPAWIDQRLGGTWVETADPYAAPDEVAYCGPGHGYDGTFPRRFAPQWVQPVATDEGWTFYPEGAVVFHNGKLWRSTTTDNVWEPGQSGWHDAPEDGYPEWVAPTGAHDAYDAGAIVTHNGQTWENTHGDGNVWEPGVYGWATL